MPSIEFDDLEQYVLDIKTIYPDVKHHGEKGERIYSKAPGAAFDFFNMAVNDFWYSARESLVKLAEPYDNIHEDITYFAGEALDALHLFSRHMDGLHVILNEEEPDEMTFDDAVTEINQNIIPVFHNFRKHLEELLEVAFDEEII